jgi:hypothetical protein
MPEQLNLSALDMLLSYGREIEIEKGSVKPAPGVMFAPLGDVEPIYQYKLRDGSSRWIRRRDLHGGGPLDTDEVAARAPDLSEFRHPADVPGIRGAENPLGLARPG